MSALLLVSLTLAAPVPKDVTAGLKWKLDKGDVFYVRYETEQHYDMRGSNPDPFLSDSRQDWVSKVTVVEGGDKAVIEVEIVRFRRGFVNEGESNKLEDVPKAVGKKGKMTLDANRNVVKMEGDSTATTWDGMHGTAKSMMLGILRCVPARSLKAGATWESETDLSAAKTYSHTKRSTGKLLGVTGDIAKLSVESEYETKIDPETITPKMVVFEDKGKGKGLVQFDTRRGRVVQIEESYEVGCTAKMPQNATQPISHTTKRTAKITVSDNSPTDQ